MGAKVDIRRAGGLTMVEILVVVAIIAIMAGIAIPSFAKMGLLWKNDLQSSARELYTLLRAARIYATTYNVETAVVYTQYNPEGLTPNNLRAAAMMYLHAANGSFYPVSRQDDGAFRTLPGETCLYSELPQKLTDPPYVAGGESIEVPTIARTNDERFRAHVFEPSGRLRVSGQQRELFTFYVRYNDAAGDDEKYVDPELGGDLTSPNGFNASNVRRIALNIYRATGRVEISSE